LPVQRLETNVIEDTTPPGRSSLSLAERQGSVRVRLPVLTTKMSMERYLKAPFLGEPTSASIVSKESHNRMDSVTLSHHSPDSPTDVSPDGRYTSFTSGKAYETFDDWFTVPSQPGPSRSIRDSSTTGKVERCLADLQCTKTTSPDRLTTNKSVGPVDMAKNWAEQMEKAISQHSPDREVDYRAKAAEEIAKIQEKARELEQMMLQYRAERVGFDKATEPVTTEAAYAQMARNPKLAWILGGDSTDVSDIGRPKSASSRTDRPPQNLNTGSTALVGLQDKPIRTTISNGTLEDGDRVIADGKEYGKAFEYHASRRVRYHCTFCQKRFYNRVEWMRHEQTIHMPGELWVCCKYRSAN
jgi:hypothetical protein